jgi:hypothetical protein
MRACRVGTFGALLVAAVGCSSQQPRGAGQGENVGVVGLALDIAPGVTIQTVTYQIDDAGGQVLRSGTIDVTNSTRVSQVVSGVPAGSGETVLLSAASIDGSATCAGKSAPFQVTPNATTSVMVLLECRTGSDAGTVIINGGTNVCPQIASATVSPAETTVGHTMALAAVGSDPDGDALTYAWTASGPGRISNAGASNATFTCTGVGAATVTVVVSDGDHGCDATQSYPVSCDSTNVLALASNAHGADAATMAALVSFNTDSGILVFSSLTPLLASLQPGDVLLSGVPDPSSPAPKGFMRKVTSVTTAGGQVQVATTQATVADAVASAFIDTHQHYPDATGAVFTAADPGVSLMPAATAARPLGPLATNAQRPPGLPPPVPLPPSPSLPPAPTTPIGPVPSGGLTLLLNNVVLSTGNSGGQTTIGGDTSGSASATVTLNGWVNLDPTVFLHLDIQGCGFLCTFVHEFDAGVTLNQSADIQSTFETDGGVAFEKTVGTIELPGFATYWLYWQPTFEVKVGVSVNGQITVTLHAVDQVNLEGGAEWNDDHMGHSGWTNLSHASASASFDVPFIQANLTAQAYVKPQFSILLYGIVGPDVSTQLGVVFDIGVPRRPFLDLHLAFVQSIGVHVSVFGFFDIDYNASLPELDFPLGQSPNIPPFILSTAPAPGTSAPLGGLQFMANAFDLQDGTNLTYAWTDEHGTVLGTGTPLLAPASLTQGTHTITVTVTDAVGAQSSATIPNVTVQPPPPQVQAFLPPINQPGQPQNQVSALDTNNCLPSPELDIVGSASGGTQPYTYSWAVTLFGEDGITPTAAQTFAPSSSTATTATLSTTQFPSSWSSLLGGGPVQIAFRVTDAAGVTSSFTQTLTWTCTIVCGHAGEACCNVAQFGTACNSGTFCNGSNVCATCPTPGQPQLVTSTSIRDFGPNCMGKGDTFTYGVGGPCTPGFHFSAAKSSTVATSTYSNSSCSLQFNAAGPQDCSVTVTAFAAQFCLPETLECTTNVFEVPDVPAGCPGN